MIHDIIDSFSIAKQSAFEIEKYLNKLDIVTRVQNVELDKEFQIIDVDLLVDYKDNGIIRTDKIEIKGDTYEKTGNYFFETVSNASKKTMGCFLYTQCDYLYYYFINIKELHILKMNDVRDWFLINPKKFATKQVYTKCEHGCYMTIGKVVPIHMVQKQVGVKIIDISEYLVDKV